MEDLHSGDPAFLEMCHRWLLFHYHCNDCGLSEDACEYGKICAYGKSTFTHVQACSRSECAFPRCDLIKSIIRHHKNCKNETCQVCAPVCKYQARSKVPPPPPPPPPPHSPYTATALSPPLSATSPMQYLEQPQPSSCPPPPPQPSPQPPKRSSSQAELDVVQPREGLHQSTVEQPPPQQRQPHAGMLFEARHREHKRHLSSSLSRSSWTLDTASASGTSSGGCTVSMASAASGSIEAVAELQALQLGRSSHHPPPQPQQLQLGHEQDQRQQQQSVQPQQQQQSTATSCLAPSACPPFARLSAPASLQHHLTSSNGIGSSITGKSNMPPTGGVDMKGFQLTAGALQQAEHQQQQPQHARQPLLQPPQPLPMPQQQQQLPQQDQQQQLGVRYRGPALTVLLQPPTPQQQQQSVTAVLPALHQCVNVQQQQQMALSVARHQAMYVPMQYACTAAAFRGGSQPQQQQLVSGVLAGAPGNLSLPTAGAVGLQANAPSYVTSLPFGTMVKAPMQMGALTPGMSYSLLHHHYGAPGQGAGMLLQPPQQQPQQQLPAQQQQQHFPGLVMGSAGAMPSSAAFFVGPQPVAGVASVSMSYRPAAELDTGSGVSPSPATAWCTYQPSGVPPLASAVPQPPQQQQQQH